MSRITVPYTVDGERKWAIWSTIVQDILLYDATAQDIIEYRAERAARKARQEEAETIIHLQNNEYQHEMMYAESVSIDARERLKEIHESGDEQ